MDLRQLTSQVTVDDLQLKRPLDTKVFDVAQRNVLLLIERDPFVRWRKAIRERIGKADGAEVEILVESADHGV